MRHQISVLPSPKPQLSRIHPETLSMHYKPQAQDAKSLDSPPRGADRSSLIMQIAACDCPKLLRRDCFLLTAPAGESVESSSPILPLLFSMAFGHNTFLLNPSLQEHFKPLASNPLIREQLLLFWGLKSFWRFVAFMAFKIGRSFCGDGQCSQIFV